jgi:hypothetical protein
VISSPSWFRRPVAGLVLALAFFIVSFGLGQQDMAPDDPLYYAEYAHEIAADPHAAFSEPSTYPWNMRIGLTVPMAGFYRAFGVSRATTNLPCLLATLAILLVAFAAVSTPRAKWLVVLFAVTCAPLIRHGAMLNADLPCGALIACSILALSRRDGPRGSLVVALAIGAWFWAFLVKETAIWCVPIWIYAIVVDLRTATPRTVLARYAPGIALGVVLTAGYLALCAAVWGDPFARFRGIQELTYAHGWTMHDKDVHAWLARLVWGPAILVALMFRALLIPAVFGIWLVRGRDAIWLMAALVLLGGFWIGSSSLTAYEPLPLWPRMVLPVLPALLVVAALGADAALDRFSQGRRRVVFAAVLSLMLVIPAAMQLVGGIRRDRSELAAFTEIETELESGAHVTLVCSDRWFPTLVRFAWGFEPPANLLLVYAQDLSTFPLPAGTHLRTIVNLGRGADLPAVRVIESLALRPLVSSGHVRLYAVDDVDGLRTALRGVPP